MHRHVAGGSPCRGGASQWCGRISPRVVSAMDRLHPGHVPRGRVAVYSAVWPVAAVPLPGHRSVASTLPTHDMDTVHRGFARQCSLSVRVRLSTRTRSLHDEHRLKSGVGMIPGGISVPQPDTPSGALVGRRGVVRARQVAQGLQPLA